MGVMGTSLSGVYGLSKAMLNSLTVTLTNELVGVNAVSPGWVKTDMAPFEPGDPSDSTQTVLRVMNFDSSITAVFMGPEGPLKFSEV